MLVLLQSLSLCGQWGCSQAQAPSPPTPAVAVVPVSSQRLCLAHRCPPSLLGAAFPDPLCLSAVVGMTLREWWRVCPPHPHDLHHATSMMRWAGYLIRLAGLSSAAMVPVASSVISWPWCWQSSWG